MRMPGSSVSVSDRVFSIVVVLGFAALYVVLVLYGNVRRRRWIAEGRALSARLAVLMDYARDHIEVNFGRADIGEDEAADLVAQYEDWNEQCEALNADRDCWNRRCP